jgi:multiple sugar transport system permease protein
MTAPASAVTETEPQERQATVRRRRRRVTVGSVVTAVLRYLALIISAVLFLLPFYLIVRNALAKDTDITAPGWKLFPKQLHWENFAELFTDPSVNIVRALANSAIIAVLQTAGILLLCSMAGYGLARIPYRWANPIFYATLVTLMIPPAVTFIPSFIIVSQLHWVDTYQGIIVPVLFSGFTTFLFRQYFLNFPRSLEEAARVDGLGYWGAFWRVVVPNSGAFFAAIAVITFIASWNAFLWPLVIGQDSSMWTVQVALSTFLTAQTISPLPSPSPRSCWSLSSSSATWCRASPKPESRADGGRCGGHSHRLARSRPRVPDRSRATTPLRHLCGAHGTLRVHRLVRTGASSRRDLRPSGRRTRADSRDRADGRALPRRQFRIQLPLGGRRRTAFRATDSAGSGLALARNQPIWAA